MKKVAIIGAGHWGGNLVRTFAQLGVLTKVCDRGPAVLSGIKASYPDLAVTSDYREILSDSAIEAVIIATPAATHYQLVKESLQSGKHVFVEKPLAFNVREGQELKEMASRGHRILMVGHILYYHNAVLKLKELIDRGELGQIQYIYSSRLNIGRIRTEENSLWSFAPHDISVILMLLKEFPHRIHSTGGSYVQKDIMDVTMTTMSFHSGVNAHIFVSWLHPFKEQKLVVIGSKKMAVFDDVSREKLFLYPHTIEWKERLPVVSKKEAQIVDFKMEEPLMNECRHFLDCLENHSLPRTDAQEGLNVLRVLEASQQSLNTRKIVYMAEAAGRKDDRYFVHESAYLDQDVMIGDGTRIWHFSHILKGSRIGTNCSLGQNVVVGPDAVIGNNCKIQNNVSVYKGVTLEDDVFCGPAAVFTNVVNPRSAIPRMNEYKTTLVKRGATVGANATILCGITVGCYAFIGAGAIVTKDVPDYALVYGNPARIQGWMCACGVKLNFINAEIVGCPDCGKKYKRQHNHIICLDSEYVEL